MQRYLFLFVMPSVVVYIPRAETRLNAETKCWGYVGKGAQNSVRIVALH